MSAGTILTGADPGAIITLLRIGAVRYASAPAAVTYDGATWAPLDFVAVETNDQASPIQIALAGPLILARQVPGAPVDLLRISGSTLLYSAIGLTAGSYTVGGREFTAVLGYVGLSPAVEQTPAYTIDNYHGLRRYEDPGMPNAGGVWKSPEVRKRRTAPAVFSAIRYAPRCNPVLSVWRFVKRADRRRSDIAAGAVYLPDLDLNNEARIGSLIPQRYGRSVFAPDIAHPPYWSGSGTTVTRKRLFCLGIGKYQINKIWVGQTLAWSNGAATGNVAGFSMTQIDPGVSIQSSVFDTTKINLSGDWAVNMQLVIKSLKISSDGVEKTWTFVPTTVTVNDTGGNPQDVVSGSDSSSLSYPAWTYLRLYGGGTSPVISISETVNNTIKLAGPVTTDSAATRQIIVGSIPVVRTVIESSQVKVVARKTSGIFSTNVVDVLVFDYEGEKQRDLNSGESFTVNSSSSFNESTFTLAKPGKKLICFEGDNIDAYMPDVAVVPIYNPPVGDGAATHLSIGYTANKDYDDAPITVEAIRYVTDPASGVSAPISNPAACAYSIAVDAVGAGNVDSAAFLAIARSDDVADVSCAGWSSTYADRWDLLTSMLRTINAKPTFIGGQISAVIDAPVSAKWFFSPASITRGSLKISSNANQEANAPDKQVIEYADKLTGAKTEAQFTRPGYAGNNVARETLEFVGDADQALAVARYSLKAARYIQSVISIEVGDEAESINICDRVHIAHPDYGLGDYSGVVDGAITWTETTVTHPSYVLFRRADGGVWGPVLADVEQVAYRGGTVPRIVRVDPTSRAAVDAAQGTLASVIAEYPVLRMEWGAFATAPPRWIVAETQGNSITLVSSAGETAQLY